MILRLQKPDRYAAVPNDIARDASLSWKARGILLLLWSLPNGWEVRRAWLEQQSNDGMFALKSGLKELRQAGLLTVERAQGADGRWAGTNWILHERSVYRRAGNRPGGKPTPYIKTETNKTEPPHPSPPPGERGNGKGGHGYPAAFELWWSTYPRRPHDSKKDAHRCWRKRLREESEDRLREAAEAYAAHVDAERTEPRYIMRAATFLGPNERWRPFWEDRASYVREPGIEKGGDF